MKKSVKFVLSTLIGLVLLGIGFLLLKTQADMVSLPYPYVLIGVGCGAFGYGVGEIISLISTRKHPEIAKQMKIEQNDERNQAIGNKAKAKAYDCMVFVFGALMLCLSLMKVDLPVILLLVSAYLFVVGYGVYYRIYYDKKM